MPGGRGCGCEQLLLEGFGQGVGGGLPGEPRSVATAPRGACIHVGRLQVDA